jgi:AraC-like DNA-binding protein
VTDIALDWGFCHFSRFSQEYRRLFGETPGKTLQRARAKSGFASLDDARSLSNGAGSFATRVTASPRLEPMIVRGV